MSRTPRTLSRTLSLLTLAAGLALPAAAQQGDRQLLRTTSGRPYVMILFDTSGSMNWSPKCTAEDMATVYDHDNDTGGDCSVPTGTPCIPVCTFQCDTGDCPVPRDGDDPSSKFRQAKEALYRVIRELTDIDYGFATYNQDNLYVTRKQWLYEVSAVQSEPLFVLAGGDDFPPVGSQEVFGTVFPCDQGAGDAEIACFANGDRAADTTDAWEITKARRLSKLGDALATVVSYYVRSGGQVYYVLTENALAVTQTLGDPTIKMRISLFQCTGAPLGNPANGCNSNGERTLVATKEIDYELVGDFVKWDFGVDRNLEQGGYDGVVRSSAGNTCASWDPNTDDASDLHPNNVAGQPPYSLRFPDGALFYDPPGTADDWKFQNGDVLPLNWTSDNKSNVLNRLAPSLGGALPADNDEAFAAANYLEDHPRVFGGQVENFLHLQNESFRPLFPNGSTPLGYSLKSLREWFRGCENGSCPADLGWDDVAALQDPNWECRKKYLVVVTDGDDTCPGRDPCSLTASMHALDDITTYVVAFGVQNTAGNRLNCMASNGGSGDPIYAQNRAEFIQALRDIFGQIKEEAVAFASAAVPTVQANVADKIYLSSFTPLNQQAIWPGRLDAFLKPLPLDDAGLPDRTIECSGSVEAACFAFDAGDSQLAWDSEPGYAPEGLLLQAPRFSEITRFDNSSLKIGTGNDERRVFFGLPNDPTPGKRQWFRYPDPLVPVEQANFEFVWNLPPPSGSAANRDTIAGVVEFTLREKQASLDVNGTPSDPADDLHMQYVMGDIFHANPGVLAPPADFDLYTKDLYWNTPLCGVAPPHPVTRAPQISYQYFSNRNLCRRLMVLVGSDDAQLHVFDGGVFEGSDCKIDLPDGFAHLVDLDDGDTREGEYSIGSGRELFSFIPAAMMPIVRELSTINELTTQYGVDATPRTADVFIDPILDPLGNPTCLEREWRTVVLGGYREGGPGLYALDITQPDTIDAGNSVPQPQAGSPAYVPSCINGGSGCGSLPFPSLLWEFVDVSDEDGVGGLDMAETWSRPVVGRMQVCSGACDSADEPEERWVAIFGGGVSNSPSNSALDETGNWLYILDIETGRIIYKRGGAGVISGAIPADITVVDQDVDGLFDSFYFGTTAGLVYKLDIGEGPFELDSLTGRLLDPITVPKRYDPFVVFSTGGKPIYLEISAVFVTKLRAHALLFGSGNRWNLWDFGGTEGRFYAIVDSGFADGVLGPRDGVLDPLGCGAPGQPLTEACYAAITVDSPCSPSDPDYLFGNPDPSMLPGWFFPLAANEKLITEPFALSGVTFFTVYRPTNTVLDGTCALGGASKIFTVNTVDASCLGQPQRYTELPKFTTQPFVEQSATQNPPCTTPGDCPPEESCQESSDAQRAVYEELKKLFPPGARFANYSLDIRTIRSDTGVVCVAPVPVAIEPRNFREF